MTRSSRYLVLALIGVVVIVLDQITKYWVMQSMRLHESIPIVPNLFSFTYIRNPGAAFGLLAGSSNAFRTVFFGITSLICPGTPRDYPSSIAGKGLDRPTQYRRHSWWSDRQFD